jgi:serine-type D-Ala-D-Ala carboxypeptidase (penicillin-binding protein 5/6)
LAKRGRHSRDRGRPPRTRTSHWYRPKLSWLAPPLAVAVAGVLVLVTANRLSDTVPASTLVPLDPLVTTVSGQAPTLPWPSAGQAAVGATAVGRTWETTRQHAVPIASLTKVMTALIVLRDHPIAPDEKGPTLVMTGADVLFEKLATDQGGTTVPVTAGEHLTERQLLDGLLVHSANNFANTLAMWDAGSIAAFVAKMNATSSGMRLHRTHYVDTNGLDPKSVSTPLDQLRLATTAMAVPTFAAVVGQPQVTLPEAGTLDNLVSDVGTDGVVGVKSGFLQLAGGCVILAAQRIVGFTHVLVLAAVTGQPGATPLKTAQDVALDLIDTVASGIRTVTVATAGQPVATVKAPWQDRRAVTISAASSLDVLGWPGGEVRAALRFDAPHTPTAPGATVGTLAASGGGASGTVPVVTDDAIRRPSIGWRILHG